MKTHKFIGVGICMLMITTIFAGIAAAEDWPMSGHDLSRTGYSTSLAPYTPSVKWVKSPSGLIYFSSEPVVVDGKIYIFDGSSDHKLCCLDAATGDYIWNYTIAGVVPVPAVVNGRVYVGSSNGNLYCLDAAGDPVTHTTTLIWTFNVGGAISASPAVANGMVYFGALDNNVMPNRNTVFCVDAAGNPDHTTTVIWKYAGTGTIGTIYSSPVVVNDRVYIGSDDKKVYCLDAVGNPDHTTTLIWSYLTSGAVRAALAVTNGKVYIGTDDASTSAVTGYLICLDAAGNPVTHTTTLIWSYPMNSNPVFNGGFSGIAIAYGKVYVDYAGYIYSTHVGDLYCFDAAGNGAGSTTMIWSFPTTNGTSAPTVADGKVFIGAKNNPLYCLDAAGDPVTHTTTILWSYNVAGSAPLFLGRPVVADGNLYIGTNSKKLYCFHRLVPQTPDIFDGSTQGSVDEELTYTVICHDPENMDIQYFIDWGDGNDSFWIPEEGIEAGEEVSASHTWNTPGDYQVRVKTRYVDFGDEGVDSSWSAPLTVHIDRLSITHIGGGLGITAQIKNMGKFSKDVNWSVELIGGSVPGFHFNKYYYGELRPLKAGNVSSFSTGPVFGLGRFKITVTAECTGEPVITKTVDGMILFFYVMIQ